MFSGKAPVSSTHHAVHKRPGRALFFALLLLSLTASRTQAQTQSLPTAARDNMMAQVRALSAVKRSWTPAQKKLNSQFVHALQRARGDSRLAAVPKLRSDFITGSDSRILVDIDATVTEGLLSAIKQGGGELVNAFPRDRAVRARLLLSQMESLAGLSEVTQIRPADEYQLNSLRSGLTTPARNYAPTRSGDGYTTNTGSVTSEGDLTHRAAEARTTFGVNGTGVKVGVISDSVDGLAGSQASGDLGTVTIIQDDPGQSGEGTAMLEIVHDLAPGAQLFFATADGGTANFAANIRALRTAGCTVIVDDVGYFSESPFQDDTVAQAAAEVVAGGVAFFSSAANSGNITHGTSSTWEGNFLGNFNDGQGHLFHDWGGTASNQIISGGSSRRVDLFWSDPIQGSSNDYDVFVVDSLGNILRSSEGAQTGTQRPYESIGTLNVGEFIQVMLFSGSPRFLHLEVGRGRLNFATTGQTHGHSAVAGAFSVAATDVGNSAPNAFTGGATNPVETFSSDGPRRIFFNADGSAITPGNFLATGGTVRQKPDITAADGGATSLTNFNPFFGTSAAAPHAAAIAALLKSANPALTLAQIRTALTSTALDIEAAGVDRDSGAGIVMAFQALNSIPRPVFTITGHVQTSAAVAVSGVSVTRTGSATPVTTNANGDFTFTNVPNGTYTLTPSKAGFIFSPTTRSATVNGANVTGQNFTATAVFSISGHIATSGGTAIANVSVTRTGSATPVLTNASGDFTFTGVSSGTYTLTPSLSGFTFSPTTRSAVVNNANLTGQNFTGTATGFTITGHIQTSAGTPVSNVSVTRSGSATAALTNASGDFTFTGVFNGTYTLTPSKSGFTFSPTTRSATVNNANLTGQNFTATAVFTISGHIQTSAGTAVSGVSVARTGGSAVTTNASGDFTFTNVPNGTYTLTPTKTGFIFSPTTRSATVNNANLISQNFTATAVFTISGHIQTSAAVAISGVSVTRTGSATPVTTNASGDFTFTGVPNGTYTLTPSKSGLTFTPTTRSATVNNANLTGQNFTGVPNTFSVSGRVANSLGAGMSGMQMQLGAVKVTTAADGAFVFNNVAPGSYTLSPVISASLAGVTFTPASRSVTVSSANVINQNFTATFRITGRITNSAGNGIGGITVRRTLGASVFNATTDSSGNFTFTNCNSGAQTIAPLLTPSLAGVSFSPASYNVTVGTANLTNINFRALFSIKGKVTNSAGVGIPNIPVRRTTGASNTTVNTDAQGDYVFANVTTGDHTIAPVLTPALTGASFSPVSRVVTVNNATLTNINFQVFFSVSGKVTTSSNVGIANVRMALATSTSTVSVFTDTNGNYSFSGVRAGSYTLTPTLTGKTFTPASKSITVSNASLSSQNFIGQ